MTIIERLRQYKELDPHKIALIVDDKKYTYGDLYDAILSIDINETSRIVNVAQTKESSKHIVAFNSESIVCGTTCTVVVGIVYRLYSYGMS